MSRGKRIGGERGFYGEDGVVLVILFHEASLKVRGNWAEEKELKRSKTYPLKKKSQGVRGNGANVSEISIKVAKSS